MKNIVRRTTLIVRDIERSAHWYEHVAGMTRYYDSEYILSGTGLPVGGEGDVTHLIIMQCEDPEIGMIGLLQWVDPVLPAPDIPTTITYGNPTFVCATDDAEELSDGSMTLTRIPIPEMRSELKQIIEENK